MSAWKGLDPGGTEQLWEDAVLLEVLQTLKSHEPFSRGDSKSPIYIELERKQPSITWSSYDANGFRPIFRKTNPWVKLGLTGPETIEAYVTPLGDELLSGEKSISEVFIDATRNFREQDGTPSFSLMCKAALILPNQVFSLADVEYAVSVEPAFDKVTLSRLLAKRRSLGVDFPRGSRRPRTLSAFMRALVSSDALIEVDGGWILNNAVAANEIAAAVLPNFAFYSGIGNIVSGGANDPGKKYVKNSVKEIKPGKRVVAEFDPNAMREYDPIKRALLLEKSNSIHESLVEFCADIIRAGGDIPVEDSNSFDIAIVKKKVIFEIKSIHESNVISQLRKAVAQLPEYAWRHKKLINGKAAHVLVTDRNPAVFAEADFLDFIEIDRGVAIFWREGNDIVNREGYTLSKFLKSL